MLRKVLFILLFVSLAACQILEQVRVESPVSSTNVPAPADAVVDKPIVETASDESPLAEPQAVEVVQVAEVAEVAEPVIAEAVISEPAEVEPAEPDTIYQHKLDQLCQEIGDKLGSVSVSDCLQQNLQFADGLSVKERVLARKEYLPPSTDEQPASRILIMGGIHGDEYSSVSIMFRWMEILGKQTDSPFHWRFLPLANPDGLLEGQAKRQNANGVDLNRNFPSEDWSAKAIDTWKTGTGSNPRRFPGSKPASEPETKWVIKQIEDFNPAVIVSVHAPHDLLDFDGSIEPPRRIGQLYLHQLGVYPGSLGNWGGLDLGIPVVTLELPSAGIMPSRQQIQNMWDDLHNWLIVNANSLTSAQAQRDNLATSD